MASVQAAPAVQPPGAGAPGLTTQQLHEMYNKYRQLKEAGVSNSDPELLKMQQFFKHVQQQQNMRRQQQQTAAAQQQQHNAQAASNGAVNGVQSGSQLESPAHQQASSSLGASAMPNSNAAPGSGAPSSGPTPSGPAGQFTPNQLQLLRQQIQAFKLLGKNIGVPKQMQQAIFAPRQRRHAIAADKSSQPGADASSSETAQPSVNGQKSAEDSVVVPKHSRIDLPWKTDMLGRPISYFAHTQRENRVQIPGVMPTGVDFEQLRAERERAVFNRMSHRYQELRSLPANFAHVDASQDELVLDDTLKRKAIIEMKSLALYSKQRALREKISRQMVFYDNLAMTTNRSSYRRIKKHSTREARITEKLEKQQRDARENREKKKHTDFLNAVTNHNTELVEAAKAQQQKMSKLGRLMLAHHSNIEKEEQKRIERTAKQRLQALKANDEEAYLKLLDQAKDTRITHLLRQTDGFLHQLASSVKQQQRQAAERYGNEELPEEEASESEEEDEQSARKIDYYAVAHRIKEEVTEQANILVGGKLKEYQIKGLQWMLSLYNNNLNGILADEMGLGKTIQTISLVTYLIERKLQDGPYLVIVPLSTLTNWNLEFEKWAPSVSRIVYKGPPNVRKQHQERIRQGRFQVLLTTYEFIIKDRPILSKIKWFHMIIDEGHRMKNSQSKLTSTITQYYNTRFRLILTGTPLQNNLGELWAMLNFVLPNIFKSAKTFDEWFNTPFANTGGQDKMELTEEEQILVIRRLHKVLRPFLLRRLKTDVEKDLPDKTEKVLKVKMSSLQSKIYRQMVTHNKMVVSDGKGGKTGARGLSNMIMQLRKLCNHPFVFDEIENVMNPLSVSNDMLWRSAGKFELLERIIPKYKATGHRLLLFFQMTSVMDIMEDFLRYKNIQYLRLDGTTKSEDRSDMLKEFNAPDSPYFMFLLSTRAGGLGLNLQTADTVIIYDSDWNPFQDLQAQDRAHRIGQKNEVRILRLITSNSVEEKILERARYKLDMDGKVIQAGRFDNKSSETDRDAMLRTLLDTAEMAESGEQEEMDDEELNMILARNDDELALFQEMDEKRKHDPKYGTAPGCEGISRLIDEKELPELYMTEGLPVEEEAEVVLGRGARERTRVRYDDGLTEEQWAMAVDDDEDSIEAAVARKQARIDRRAAKRAAKGGDIDDSPSVSRASTEELETPVKKRGRKPGSKNEKRKAEELDDEPPVKKRKGPLGRPKNVVLTNGGEGGITAQQRQLLQETMQRLYDGLINLEVDYPAPEGGNDDDDEEPPKRIISPPFQKLPSKRDYGDYYMVIKQPICFNIIEKKMKKKEYGRLSDMQSDVRLLCNNCRTYNDDGSLLYQDANTIESWFDEKVKEALAAHSELRELEDPSQKENASGAATGTATPQSTPSVLPKIKLISNSAASQAASSTNAGDSED